MVEIPAWVVILVLLSVAGAVIYFVWRILMIALFSVADKAVDKVKENKNDSKQ